MYCMIATALKRVKTSKQHEVSTVYCGLADTAAAAAAAAAEVGRTSSLSVCDVLRQTAMTWFICILVLGLLHSATSTRHDDKHSSSSSSTSVLSQWNERRHRRSRDDGTCELEIHCGGGSKGDGQRTSTSGVVRLPIRGQRGPPGAPKHQPTHWTIRHIWPPGASGAKGEKGHSGTDGDSGLLCCDCNYKRVKSIPVFIILPNFI